MNKLWLELRIVAMLVYTRARRIGRAIISWLKRPALRANVLLNAFIVVVLAVYFTHLLVHRAAVRNEQQHRTDMVIIHTQQTNAAAVARIDLALCTVLEIIPPEPAPIQAAIKQSEIRAHCMSHQ